MAERSIPGPNPFAGPAPRDPMRVYQPLTAQELLNLDRAPKRGRPGTEVTVRAYDIPWLPGKAEHMYVQYDDGREQLIARGGPSNLGAALYGNLTVRAGVTPARDSRDYGNGGRVVYRGFLPDRSAEAAAAGARRHADEVIRDRRRYTIDTNSNSYAADVVEPLFGVRPGDSLTPGYQRRLNTAPRVRPYDISPAMRLPGS